MMAVGAILDIQAKLAEGVSPTEIARSMGARGTVHKAKAMR